MTKMPPQDSLSEAILEMAGDLHHVGLIDDATHTKITLRHLRDDAIRTATPITAEEIRSMREEAHVSQAVFARYLNLTVGYVSQLERGTRQPKGPALTLLNVIRRKGLQSIL